MEAFNFTESKLEKLKPAKKTYQVADTKTPFLMLLVYPSGGKTFCYYRRIEGKNPTRKTIGKMGNISLEAARQEAIKMTDIINQKRNPLKNSKLEKMYFSQCYDMFIKFKENMLSAGSIYDYKNNWKNHLEPELSYKRMYEIDTDLLQNIHLKMKETPYQANRTIVLVKSIYNYMIRKKGYAGTNPANGVELYEEKPRNTILFPDEIKRILEAMKNDKGSSYLADIAILFLILYGGRKNEVLTMKWSDLDLKNKTWTIPKTKNGDPKSSTITNLLLPFLERLEKEYKIEGNDYVLPSLQSKTGHIVEIRHHFDKLVKSVGITRKIRIHDIRHTYGTMSTMLNHSPSVIKTELGHRTMNASNRYINLASQMITNYRDETMNKLLGAITTPDIILDNSNDTDDSIAMQIAKNMKKSQNSLDIITKPMSQDEMAKMFNEKRKNYEKLKQTPDAFKNMKK